MIHMKLKGLTAAAVTAAVIITGTSGVSAAESWRDAFTTRLMNLMSQDTTYRHIVLTDLDCNGVPEAFLIKEGPNGGIGAGITMQGSVVTTIDVPKNVIGTCLEDLTLYNDDGEYQFVGREVGRYNSSIEYYYIQFSGTTLTCSSTKKEVFKDLEVIPYLDYYGYDFMINGFPNRSKIEEFINNYTVPNNVRVTVSDSQILVNGNSVAILGYNIAGSNYYKIRDIAMLLRTTGSRFNVEWDADLGAISISTGSKYTIVGGELDLTDISGAADIQPSESLIYLDGMPADFEAYNINGSSYFKIRDVGDAVGFEVSWNSDTNMVEITTR